MARGTIYYHLNKMVERIYGRDGEHETCYLTRVKLSPTFVFGGLYLHVFHRGDADPDPHDHPWNFWTLPLTPYCEEVMGEHGDLVVHKVRALRLHYRRGEHTHRVLGRSIRAMVQSIPGSEYTWLERGTIVTLVWHGPKRRSWGFWVHDPARKLLGPSWQRAGNRAWVYWRDYVFKRQRQAR